ncbi:MAG: ArnT family glycosyltransferase [Pyrinomonadaceae bacterium]
MLPSTLAKRISFFLIVLIAAFYLYALGHLPLVGPDEPRYAEVAREMYLRHDWITPILGGHTWFEKPALLYWIMIVAFKILGVTETAARIGPAFCGISTFAAVLIVGRKVSKESRSDELSGFGLWSAITAATSLGLIVFSRGASFDIVITATLTWAFSFFLLSELVQTSRMKLWLLGGFYVAVGFSLLAKGLVGAVIPAGVGTLYFLMRGRWPGRSFWLSLLWGVPLSLAIAAIWYGPVIARHGWTFIDQFIIQHHFARYFSNKYHHPQPIYFYLLILLPLTLPWSAFLVEALAKAMSWTWRADDPQSKARVFFFSWLVVPILFFSFSGSKLPGYILPVLPAAACLIAERVIVVGRDSLLALRATGLICWSAVLAAVVYASRSSLVSTQCAALITAPVFAAGFAALFIARARLHAVFAIALATVLSLAVVLNCGAYNAARRESVRDLLRTADSDGYVDAIVFAGGGDDRTAEFYASGRVVYDSQGEPVRLDQPWDAVSEARQRRQRVLALFPIELLGSIRQTPGLQILGDNGRLILVAVSDY